ncbi:hypothetical protein EDD36DRAFT_421237 [Exophiala viscosa]|uniref:WSC domain-containing protein n=1 Tax=Exophiala viscosa TaxID=2486360 RepID=A0AAN6IAB3_9EURO|nr:hypothetical protein EDD36DRAFT_421237 [Exophiala viscosa]
MLYPFLLLGCLGTFLQGVQALEVTNTSSCVDTCGGVSLTWYTNLTCSDDGYFGTSKGEGMRECLVCESTSSADNGDLSTPQNNDIYWFLCKHCTSISFFLIMLLASPSPIVRLTHDGSTVNMKYTLEYCLFESNSSTPSLPECQADCAGLYPVLMASWFSPTAAKQYEYCSINDTAFTEYAGTCASCLQAGTGSVVLGNFLNAMQSACTSQPDATLGETVPIKRELFNTTTVGTATATATTSSSQTSAAVATTSSSTTPSSSSSSASSSSAAAQSENKSSGLSTGAAAGIGVGCAIVAIALLGGLAWFFLSAKRRSRRQAATEGSDFADTKTPFVTEYGHAQQLGSTEVHEIDSTHGGESWTNTNELDGRPTKR